MCNLTILLLYREKVSVKMEEVDSIRNELGIRETIQIGWRKLFCCTDRFEVSKYRHSRYIYKTCTTSNYGTLDDIGNFTSRKAVAITIIPKKVVGANVHKLITTYVTNNIAQCMLPILF